ncbi:MULTISPECIES: GIY-YIG nuclease family protein [Parabacteroides]|jgi:hypothetical protein|uniref:GIY-YIG nuclease family protein n=1 Tax=Parabacteroides TaxID=375288 RepID=UPI00068362D8|nr:MULTISPECIES: GIY-YIG nuclease family protein [Parabacteroides]MBM6558862.1 GIY-YIG nuclease family protein [Parabacteroides distasonis]
MGNMDEENYGIVYALTNPAMPGLVKIGMTSKLEIDQRKNQLYFGSSGVPLPFECVYACKVKDFEKTEKALHIAFAPHRINPNREFFKMEVERVIAILELLGPNNAIKEVEEDLEAGISDQERSARESMKKRAPFSFERMMIPVGAKLNYRDDDSVEIEVAEKNKVIYNGETMSLTAVTRLFKPYVVHPTPYWTYEGNKLSDLWEISLGECCSEE